MQIVSDHTRGLLINYAKTFDQLSNIFDGAGGGGGECKEHGTGVTDRPLHSSHLFSSNMQSIGNRYANQVLSRFM